MTDHTIQSINQSIRAFTGSRIILTGVELDLFTLLDGEALSAEEITARLESDFRATTILLDALAGLGFLVKDAGLYRTEPSAARFLSDNSSDSILPSVRHSVHLWQTWAQLTDIVREGGPAKKPDRPPGEYTRAFIGAMHVRAVREADEMVQVIDPGATRSLIDVGGGSGSYTVAFLRAVPEITATLFDLPEVIELARERMKEEGLLDRVDLVAGNFYEDEFPGGHDLALLSAIIHQNRHDENEKLYEKVYRSLNPGGRVVISDFILEPDRTRPLPAAIFAVNMLVNTHGGNAYTFAEIKKGLEAAGFSEVRIIVNDERFSLVEAFVVAGSL